ncbi:MAG TPA: helix-turn-helix transcriptional regulator [Bacteroidales bacterium]|nr:helix-turn-helix transcriptional regulator [Bacteroidales bacterium]
MKLLKVVINKAGNGVSAHLPELDGFLLTARSVTELKNKLRESILFHIEGLYPEERRSWMDDDYDFEFVFCDIPSLVSGYSETISQNSLARIAGVNESQMRQYASGLKKPSRKVLKRIEDGLHRYADDIRKIHFEMI